MTKMMMMISCEKNIAKAKPTNKNSNANLVIILNQSWQNEKNLEKKKQEKIVEKINYIKKNIF